MANYVFDYSAGEEIAEMFQEMDETLKNEIKSTIKEIGNELKSNTETCIPRQAVAKHGVHIADDVKLSTSVNDKKATATVKGGKTTGGYWWNIDNGHMARDGKTFVPGVHFTDLALQMTNPNDSADQLIARLTK